MPSDQAAEPVERGPHGRVAGAAVPRVGVPAADSRHVPGSGMSSAAPRRASGCRSGWAKSTPPCTSTVTPSSCRRSASWATTHSPHAVR